MSAWKPIRTLEARERVVSLVVDRLRADKRSEIAAALELELELDLSPVLAKVARLERVAAIITAHPELEAHAFLYAIAHECSARRADARQARKPLERPESRDFPSFPSVRSRTPAVRVSRPSQLGLGLGGATAAPQSPSRATEQPERLAPWQRQRRAL